jgi:hypothetical protein
MEAFRELLVLDDAWIGPAGVWEVEEWAATSTVVFPFPSVFDALIAVDINETGSIDGVVT